MAWRLNVSSTAQQDNRLHRREGDNDKDTYPGTVVIEAIHAIVAETAVRGTRWPEYLAGEAILQLDRLPLDEHLLGAWRRAVCGTVQRVWHFYIRNTRRRSPQQKGSNGCGPEMQHQHHRQRWRQSHRSLLTCKKRGRGRKSKSFLILNIFHNGNNSNSLG